MSEITDDEWKEFVELQHVETREGRTFEARALPLPLSVARLTWRPHGSGLHHCELLTPSPIATAQAEVPEWAKKKKNAGALQDLEKSESTATAYLNEPDWKRELRERKASKVRPLHAHAVPQRQSASDTGSPAAVV